MAKILIIEDDPNLRRGMNLRLRANGYETALAEDGVSASSHDGSSIGALAAGAGAATLSGGISSGRE